MTGSSGLLNMMRREASKVAARLTMVRVGIVSAYDPNKYAVKVELQPDGQETGWLPVLSPWVGNGWGLFAPPTPGNVVDVHFQEGSKDAGYVSLCFFSNVTRPLPVSSGEFWLFHKSGAFIKLTNDGKASINSTVEIDVIGPTVNVTATAAVNVTAPSINLGSNGEALHKMVTDAMVALFNSHTHSGVQAGGGNTGTPTTTMGAAQLTSVTSAG